MKHELKTVDSYFDAVWEKKKLFEIRINDRDFKVGDTLLLREIKADMTYTGRAILCDVTYILELSKKFTLHSLVVMSVKLQDFYTQHFKERDEHEAKIKTQLG